MKTVTIALLITWFTANTCHQPSPPPDTIAIAALKLKQGAPVVCGPADKQYGNVDFPVSCKPAVAGQFVLGVKMLHSFEYDEAEKVFAGVIASDPSCAMAYWGVAMSNFHPLWTPPTGEEMQKGANAVAIAQSLDATPREKGYIDAIAAFYAETEQKPHAVRTQAFANAMEKLQAKFTDDVEAKIFYALALVAAADPTDTSFANQKKAGLMLEPLYRTMPQHPGVVHYLIHTYDYPSLANKGLAAARAYATVAPSSAHALHMPSHIFTRLGYWTESIQSNQASVGSARCYAEAAGIKGHWDEELHGLDYLVYAYLQRGANDSALHLVHYLQGMEAVEPLNSKVAYAFAAIPARYALENKRWSDAAKLEPAVLIDWKKFPWQQALVTYARMIGQVRMGQPGKAAAELASLQQIQKELLAQKDAYKANQVAIQIETGEAWIALANGRHDEALARMQRAAQMEDLAEKHPVTPAELLPARELLGDMLLQLKQPAAALAAYQQSLRRNAGRFNSLYGAATAATAARQPAVAADYSAQLQRQVASNSNRPELGAMQQLVAVHRP